MNAVELPVQALAYFASVASRAACKSAVVAFIENPTDAGTSAVAMVAFERSWDGPFYTAAWDCDKPSRMAVETSMVPELLAVCRAQGIEWDGVIA